MRQRPPRPRPAPVASGDPSHDAFLEAELERAIAPYRGRLPPAALEAFRARAAAYLATDPQMVALAAVARRRGSAQQTAVQPTESAQETGEGEQATGTGASPAKKSGPKA